MAESKFKDSKGREFAAEVVYESGRGVDACYILESAYYTDDDSAVPEFEIEFIYNLPGNPVNVAGYENAS